MVRQRRQAVKGRVGQAPWRARAALRMGSETEALWRTAAVAAAGTALAGEKLGVVMGRYVSGLALRGWRGAACCIAHEARERISAFAWLASRVLWLCCCCVHAVDGLCVCSLHVQAQERGGGEESKWLMEKKKRLT